MPDTQHGAPWDGVVMTAARCLLHGAHRVENLHHTPHHPRVLDTRGDTVLWTTWMHKSRHTGPGRRLKEAKAEEHLTSWPISGHIPTHAQRPTSLK